MPSEDLVDDLILVAVETPGVTEEILLPSEPLMDNEADEEDSASIEAELNDVAVEEEVVKDEETVLSCGDSDGRAESRMQSPEPDIYELLGEGSDVSRPASRMSLNGEDAFQLENSTPVPESVKEHSEDALASQSSKEFQDKSKGKRICLRKKSTDSDPEQSQSSHGISDTDVEMARKRRRSMLGEEYDNQMKSKQRRLSKTAGEKEKRSLSSSEEAMICPVEDCGKELVVGEVEKIAKHLIKHHLSKPPSCLYAEEKDSNSHKCNPCDFSTTSLSSFWAHEAVKHRLVGFSLPCLLTVHFQEYAQQAGRGIGQQGTVRGCGENVQSGRHLLEAGLAEGEGQRAEQPQVQASGKGLCFLRQAKS